MIATPMLHQATKHSPYTYAKIAYKTVAAMLDPSFDVPNRQPTKPAQSVKNAK